MRENMGEINTNKKDICTRDEEGSRMLPIMVG